MSRVDFTIITNNPLVRDKYQADHNVEFYEVNYEEILKKARDRIYDGHKLLTHPLSGSVKPNETLYKSMLLTVERGNTDSESVRLIENAILACGKFEVRYTKYPPKVMEDFQLIDRTLIDSGIASAEM